MEPIRDRLKGIRHMAKAAAKAEKPLTKVQIFTNIAEATGLTKKQIAEVFDALKAEIASSIGKKGVGAFVIPDLCKILRHRVEVTVVEAALHKMGVPALHVRARVIVRTAKGHRQESLLLLRLPLHVHAVEKVGNSVIGQHVAIE